MKTNYELAIRAALKAGEAILEVYNSDDFGIEAKEDASPLTLADQRAHNIILELLEETALPVLSEEGQHTPYPERSKWNRFWLVDPLDGTKEFLARTGEFTINIALIDDHLPVLGLLYVPLTHKAYVGIPGSGARCYQLGSDGLWCSAPLTTQRLRKGESMTVLASRRHHGPQLDNCFNWLQRHWGSTERINSGSAIKFCQMVEGKGDFYPRFSPCCEWDTAAGQALLEAAGGCLLGMDGQPFRYNARDSLLNPDFYAISDADNPFWRRLFDPDQRHDE